jgi:hypothetical protein
MPRANSTVRGTAIPYSCVQIAIFVVTAGYLGYWAAEQRTRSARSWDEIAARLQPDLRRAALGTSLAVTVDRLFSREEIEAQARSAHGRRTMFHNAGVMLEMAEYAERYGGTEIAPLIASLRSHAWAIRLATAKSVVRITPAQRAA